MHKFLLKDKVFVVAVLASIVLHIFWISVVKVVSKQDDPMPIKFSKVSFLGPLLAKGSTEVGLSPREHSFLEKSYLLYVNDVGQRAAKVFNRAEDKNQIYGFGEGLADRFGYFSDNRKITGFVENSIGSNKVEPVYSEE